MAGRELQLQDSIEKILLTPEEIRTRVVELAQEIENAQRSPDLTFVILLHGSLLFAADLMRAMSIPLYLETIRVSSYRGGTSSTGVVSIENLESLRELRGKPVMVLDDILDTGRTLHEVSKYLTSEIEVSSLETCVLLDKNVERSLPFQANYVGFPIGDEFVVGYGLDYRGRYRNLPYIGTLTPEAISSEC